MSGAYWDDSTPIHDALVAEQRQARMAELQDWYLPSMQARISWAVAFLLFIVALIALVVTA